MIVRVRSISWPKEMNKWHEGRVRISKDSYFELSCHLSRVNVIADT
jgi:hypothetical protein